MTLSYHSAGDMVYKTGSLTVYGPRVRQKQGKQQPHK